MMMQIGWKKNGINIKSKALYISKNVLLTTSQNLLFSSVEINTIPDYYFEAIKGGRRNMVVGLPNGLFEFQKRQ